MLDYLRLLRRGWLLVLCLTMLGLGLAAAATARATPVYESYGSVVIAATAQQGENDARSEASTFSLQRGSTYAALVTSDLVIVPAAAGLGITADELRGSVTAQWREGTAIVDVSGRASDPSEAARRVNAVAEQLRTAAPLVDNPGASGLVDLQVITEAQPTGSPIAPRPLNNMLIGGLIGLALGVAGVVVISATDTRVRTASDLPSDRRIATVTSLPVRRSRGTRVGGQRTDLRQEAFRHLRTNLQFSSSTGKQLAVAGTTSHCDAASVADQLASVMGEIGLNVVVVDARLRPDQRAQHTGDAVSSAPGLADVLAEIAQLEDVIARGQSEGVDVIPAGSVKEWSAQLISTSTMADALHELSQRYDFVIVSAPPVLEQSESVVVAALCGSSLLVVESGSTRRPQLVASLDLLASAGVTSASVAVDHVTLRGEFGSRRDAATSGAS